MATGMKLSKTVLLGILCLQLAGCAGGPPLRETAGDLPLHSQCHSSLKTFHRAVEKHQVREASSHPVGNALYLRTNRMLTSLENQAHTPEKQVQLLRWMRELDREATRKEVLRLPSEAVPALLPGSSAGDPRRELTEHLDHCAEPAFESLVSRPDAFPRIFESARVPDEYSLLLRTVGLYPLAGLPVAVLTAKARHNFRGLYSMPLEQLPVKGQLKTYTPDHRRKLTRKDIETLLDESSRNPLDVPFPRASAAASLAETFAPIFQVDTADGNDLPGAIHLADGSLGVDTENPTVYHHFSHALVKGVVLLQINYVVWFPRRVGPRAPLIERGNLDGLTVRITLARDGTIFMVDLMSTCGCYHAFIPPRERVLGTRKIPNAFDPFVPQWLPHVPEGERVVFRINSGWHQVERVLAAEKPEGACPYRLAPYAELELIPTAHGPYVSLFDTKGIARGSRRVEPLLLFPMGIPSIGSMRQRGRHAIDFFQRAHFDDPRLLEHNFDFR